MLKEKFLLGIFLLSSGIHAAGMASLIDEALYLFEMKGEYAEAQAILEKVSVEGDIEDKEAAFFNLGKIFELSGNHSSALFYYREALTLTTSDKIAYYLAGKITALDSSPEPLVKNYHKLTSPVTRVFPGEPPAIVLENGQLFRFQNQKWTVSPSALIPENAIVHAVSSTGIWFSLPDNFTLHFQPHQSQKKGNVYPLNSQVTSFLLVSPNQAVVNTERELFFASAEGVRYSVNNRYKDCLLSGVFSHTNQLILNCPDNALHLIQVNDGSENAVISQVGPIQNVLVRQEGIILTTANSIWFYKPLRNWGAAWHISGGNIEDVSFFGKHLAVLESSGNLLLLDLENGNTLSKISTGGEEIHPMHQGMLGVFTQEGTLTVFDTLLAPLWKFHFGQRLSAPPVYIAETTFLPLANNTLAAINPLYYGKKPLVSQILAEEASRLSQHNHWSQVDTILDSLFRLEPGNATAWFLHAVSLERSDAPKEKQQLAWSEVARFSIEDPDHAPAILNHYSHVIGARYVKVLHTSPRTLYPSLFGDSQNLYTVDVATESIQNINPENGTVRWVRSLGKLENSPVMLYSDQSFIIASGFKLNFYHFGRENLPPESLELPGKPFQMHATNQAVYISTWNGFLIKVLKQKLQFAWSRKIFTLPFHFTVNENTVSVASLDGEILQLDENSGQILRKTAPLHTPVAGLQKADSLLVITLNDNQIRILTPQFEKQAEINTKQGIASLQTLNIAGKSYLLAGQSGQLISLYETKSGNHLWSYQGQGSIFVSPVIHENMAWIDQKNEIIGIALPEGTVKQRFKTPGGSGPPLILNRTLFSASPKKLLYAFPLSENRK
ncbi:MAG: hypothetical protein LBR60_09355 [Fibrobacter sp.]|jgi:outer membrane protein assembly factor BamB|nr:hypothetical protein [Fibrobacter sp.]